MCMALLHLPQSTFKIQNWATLNSTASTPEPTVNKNNSYWGQIGVKKNWTSCGQMMARAELWLASEAQQLGSRPLCSSCKGITPGCIPVVPKLQCKITAQPRVHLYACKQWSPLKVPDNEGVTASAAWTPTPSINENLQMIRWGETNISISLYSK